MAPFTSPFTSWISEPHPGRGVHLADDEGGWSLHGYTELAASARRVATGMIKAGVRPGDVVCVVLPTGYPCLSAIFGAWTAGATISLPPPPTLAPDGEYLQHVAAILHQARPALTVTSEDLAPLVAQATEAADLPGEPWTVQEAGEPAEPRPPGEIALLQFTSGSSGEPLGARVSWDNLAANLAVIKRVTGWRSGYAHASWLPLYHDMGLIGGLLHMVARQCDLWLMRPDQFIRDPLRFLACFDRGRARMTASPSFTYGYLARKVPPEALTGLDLSQWRTAIVGAEPVDPVALEKFARFAEPAGFSRRTFVPAYGLAEHTLAVTGTDPDEVPRIARPDWSTLRFGEAVDVRETALLGEAGDMAGAGWLAGHGLPTQDVGVRIVGEDGETLPDGHLGELVLSGASVVPGYHGGRAGTSTRFVDGELHTGDAGFRHGGDVYVLGRMGDSLKLRGRNVYVEDLDAKVAAATGLGRGHLAVVSMVDAGRTGVAVFAEADPGSWVEDAARVLRQELGPEPELKLVAGPRGLVQRTSSGKVRRRHMWRRFQEGGLAGATVLAEPP
jgi:fatty-acyl-CoA synthase